MSLHHPEFSNSVPTGWVTLEEVNTRCARRGVLPPLRTVLHLGERLAAALAYVDGPPRPNQPRPKVHWDVSPHHVLLGPGGRIGMSVDSTPSDLEAQPRAPQNKLATLGDLLYETLTGAKPARPPFGQQVSIAEPSYHRADVSADLDAALMGCIQPKATEPIPSAEALGDLLAQLLRKSEESPPSSSSPAPEAGTCRVTARFLLDLFPDLSSHPTLRVTPPGEAPSWLPLAHLTPAPSKVGPNTPAPPLLISEGVPMGNEWEVSEDSGAGLENEGASAVSRPGQETPARGNGQQALDPFIERRGDEPDLYVERAETPYRLLWAALAILGPLVILAIGQALKH